MKPRLIAGSFALAALGVLFTISSSHACCKEKFVRTKPHVNVWSTKVSSQNTLRTVPLWASSVRR